MRTAVPDTSTPLPPPATAPRRTVVVCTPTCQRPQNLTALLESLRGLDRTGIDLRVVVVDNDPAETARLVVARAMHDAGIPVTYDAVAERNLPVVRNRLVSLAAAHAPDWIWFLDDDQLVEPLTLRRMLATAETSSADCVVARVPHIFEPSAARPWARWSHLFDEDQRPTGQVTRSFGTNGPLIRYAAMAEVEGPFDPRLKFVGGHHGGEDSDFFARFHARGFRSVGCNEAVIWDRLHASRNTPRWLTQRALRIGLVKGFLVREVQPAPLRSARWLALGAGYAGLNLLATVALLPLGPSRAFPCWIRAAQGYGVALGVLTGRTFLRGPETSHVHGR